MHKHGQAIEVILFMISEIIDTRKKVQSTKYKEMTGYKKKEYNEIIIPWKQSAQNYIEDRTGCEKEEHQGTDHPTIHESININSS